MQIFLTYASEQKSVAESIAFSLRSRGFKVFLDKDDLPAGRSYDEQIEAAIDAADYLIFLVSPQSVQQGRYTLTELQFARRKWRTPDGAVLPVMVTPTEMATVPEYLRAVTILEPQGNIAAEVAAHVKDTDKSVTKNLLLYFLGAGVVSGLLSHFVSGLPGEHLLKPFGFNMSIYPGIYFGVALSLLLFWKLRVPIAKLIVVLVVVQIAWQLAVHSGLAAGDILELKLPQVAEDAGIQPDGTTTDSSSSADSTTPATGTEEQQRQSMFTPNSNMLIPGFFAGLVGAFGTWLAGAIAVRRLIDPGIILVVTVTGGIAGLLLYLNHGLVLYPIWQSLVAGSIGYGLIKTRA